MKPSVQLSYAGMPLTKAGEAIAEATKDAYSADRYRSWPAVCTMLLRRGFSPLQVESIVRSKWTRWAADNQKALTGRPNAADLARFLDDPRNFRQGLMKAVEELVAGYGWVLGATIEERITEVLTHGYGVAKPSTVIALRRLLEEGK